MGMYSKEFWEGKLPIDIRVMLAVFHNSGKLPEEKRQQNFCLV